MPLPSPPIAPSTSPSDASTVVPPSTRDPSLSSNLGKQLNKESDLEDNAEDGVRLENGIFVVRLSDAKDPLSPLNFSKAKKYLILALISSCSLCVTSASSMVPFTYGAMQEEFQVSEIVATLGLSLFVIGLGWAPLVLSPLSEFYGRRPVYNLGFALFFITNFLVAFSNNITAFLIGRFLSGAAGSAFLSVAGGSIADMFAPNEVGAPLSVYTASPFIGPAMGPIISGFINSNLYWRWTWRIMIIWSGIQLILLLIFVPETYLPAILMKKAVALRKSGRTDVKAPLELDPRSIPRVLVTSCARPFQIMVSEPMAFLLCLATSLLLAIIYMFFSSFSIIYGIYGFSTSDIGLAFLGQAIGVVLGSLTHPIWARYYKRVTEETGKRPPPEEHLRRGVVGAIIIPISLFIFAFTTYSNVPYAISLVASVFFGIGTILAFSATFTFLVDAYRPVAASAMALNSCMRASLAAGFPLFTAQLFATLGTQYALLLCAVLTLILFPIPFYYFFRHGAKLRKGSKFANQD